MKEHLIKNEKRSCLEDFLKANKEEKIYFPFVIIQHPNIKEYNIDLIISESKRKFFFGSNKKVDVYGDVELLKKIYSL